VRGATGPTFDAIRAVPGVLAIHQKGDGGSDVAAFEVEAEAGKDIRPDLARAIVQKGFDLLGLSQVGMSLEEIFLHLTTTDATEAPATAAGASNREVTA
jgi:ABC-2 type transport system ATP-binding protein